MIDDSIFERTLQIHATSSCGYNWTAYNDDYEMIGGFAVYMEDGEIVHVLISKGDYSTIHEAALAAFVAHHSHEVLIESMFRPLPIEPDSWRRFNPFTLLRCW